MKIKKKHKARCTFLCEQQKQVRFIVELESRYKHETQDELVGKLLMKDYLVDFDKKIIFVRGRPKDIVAKILNTQDVKEFLSTFVYDDTDEP